MSGQCEFIFRRGANYGQQCSKPAVDGTIYCAMDCTKKVNHPLPLIRGEITEAIRSHFAAAEKLKIKDGKLVVKYPHPLKRYSVRRLDRARAHFVNTAEAIKQLEDLQAGDMILIKGAEDPIIYQEDTIDKSTYPLLYWEYLRNREPIELPSWVLKSISEPKDNYVTFMCRGVEHKIVNDDIEPEKFIEELMKIQFLSLYPDYCDEVEGENVFYASSLHQPSDYAPHVPMTDEQMAQRMNEFMASRPELPVISILPRTSDTPQ